jgi:hypothetical protein
MGSVSEEKIFGIAKRHDRQEAWSKIRAGSKEANFPRAGISELFSASVTSGKPIHA